MCFNEVMPEVSTFSDTVLVWRFAAWKVDGLPCSVPEFSKRTTDRHTVSLSLLPTAKLFPLPLFPAKIPGQASGQRSNSISSCRVVASKRTSVCLITLPLSDANYGYFISLAHGGLPIHYSRPQLPLPCPILQLLLIERPSMQCELVHDRSVTSMASRIACKHMNNARLMTLACLN